MESRVVPAGSDAVDTTVAIPFLGKMEYHSAFFLLSVALTSTVFLIRGWSHIQKLTAPPQTIDIDGKAIELSGYVSVVKISGSINEKSADKIISTLKQAFADTQSKGVVLKINSTGGSAVHSSIIFQEILKLKMRHKKKVVAVGEESLQSGAYWIAASADQIYVNANTMVGSIGVISVSFGIPELVKRIGIEPRVHTAGEKKDSHSMFKQESAEDVRLLRENLETIHANFKLSITAARGIKIPAETNMDILFNGSSWVGSKAVEIRLVDKLGTLSDAIENEFQAAGFKEYTSPRSFWANLFSDAFSDTLSDAMTKSVSMAAANASQLHHPKFM